MTDIENTLLPSGGFGELIVRQRHAADVPDAPCSLADVLRFPCSLRRF